QRQPRHAAIQDVVHQPARSDSGTSRHHPRLNRQPVALSTKNELRPLFFSEKRAASPFVLLLQRKTSCVPFSSPFLLFSACRTRSRCAAPPRPRRCPASSPRPPS